MNELSKANEWEFWDYEMSASYLQQSPKEETKIGKDGCCCKKNGPSINCTRSHVLPSHVEVDTTRHDEDDVGYVDKAWREFDSYESIMHSPAYPVKRK